MIDPATAAQATVRETADSTRAGDWATVLAAAGIGYRLEQTDGGWALIVDTADERTARSSLDTYDTETAAIPIETTPPDARSSLLGVMVALVLVGFYGLTGPREAVSPTEWFPRGEASSQAILAGQWWRAITALTLHADLLHLFGNVVATVIFVGAAGRWLGPGMAAALMMAAAAAANVLTAVVHGPGHHSVGASTATFAALGILAGLQLIRRWRLGPLKRRAWLPIGAGLALFAMLGVGEHADVVAHLFGLGVGAVVGTATAVTLRQRVGVWPQLAGGLAATAAVALSWLLAFTR
jgi:membrane associated rhomboid family serine protease